MSTFPCRWYYEVLCVRAFLKRTINKETGCLEQCVYTIILQFWSLFGLNSSLAHGKCLINSCHTHSEVASSPWHCEFQHHTKGSSMARSPAWGRKADCLCPFLIWRYSLHSLGKMLLKYPLKSCFLNLSSRYYCYYTFFWYYLCTNLIIPGFVLFLCVCLFLLQSLLKSFGEHR